MANHHTLIKKLPTFTTTPFEVTGLKVVKKEIHRKRSCGVNLDTGEALDIRYATETKEFTVDTRPHRKIYVDFCKTLPTLTPAEIVLVCYVIENLPVDSDRIYMTYKLVQDWWGKKFSYHNAINGLFSKRILAKYEDHPYTYFINTNLFFNGRRKL